MGRRTNVPLANTGGAQSGVPRARQEDVGYARWASPTQQQEFAAWLHEILLRAGYAATRPNGAPAYWMKALSRASGVSPTQLDVLIRKGRRPTPSVAVALARALGLHPLAMLYRAGYLAEEQLLALVGTGQLPSPDELREGLAALDQLPAGLVPPQVIAQQRSLLAQMLAWLEERVRELALTAEDFGPVAAERIRREILADQTPIALPADPLAGATLPGGSHHVPAAPPGPSAVQPGPTRPRIPDGSPPDAESEAPGNDTDDGDESSNA